MNLPSLSIERPVLASVFAIAIILFGVIGFTYLGVREYPSVDPPIITVTTNYVGANADVLDSQITEPLEESINGISGVKTLSSISADGRSTITVEFDLGIDLNDAANDVRDKVSRAIRNLPPDADPPIVNKSDADAQTIMAITVQSDRRDLLELTDIGINIFKERLQTIPGVSEIRIWGEKKYAMRLTLDPNKLAAYGLTPLDVRTALLAQNVEIPSGRVEGYKTELTIRTYGRLTTEEDFNDLIIRENNDQLIRLKDVGIARLAPENMRTLLRGNNKIPMIGVAITPQPGSNYIEIVDAAKERLDLIKKDLPEDIVVDIAIDTTISIRKGINEVQETILIAFSLVVLVVFVFLRDWRSTLIPILAIPISLIGTFFVMYIAGFSINILTLLGIVLATGLVVDDAIVMMENIYAKIERGDDPMEAGHKGAKEIFFAIIATTITLVAVFFPIVFLGGITGRLFREFGIVVASAIVISTFVSLSLTPMMSARILRANKKHGRLFVRTSLFLDGLTLRYGRSLRKFMKHRKWAFAIMGISVAMIFLIGSLIPSELAPMEDKSRLRLFSSAPEGTSFERMDEYVLDILDIVDTLPEKEAVIAVTSPGFLASNSVNSGFVSMVLKDPSEREKSQAQLAAELSGVVRNYTFARTFVTQEQTIGGSFGRLPVQYVLQAPNLEKLREVIPKFMEEARQSSYFEVVDRDLKFNKPELLVEINREKARELGVSVRDIAETIQLLFSGQRFGFFIMNGKQYQVIGEAYRSYRDEPSDIRNVNIRATNGNLIPLSNLVTLKEQITPPQLYRYNRFVSATISAAPASGVTLGEALEEMDRIGERVLDESFSTSLAGTSKEFMESSNSLLFAFTLALMLIYLTLAGQFESYRDPLTIMLTVPLAIAGAILTLYLFGQTLNIFSQIGIIVLIGIVTKNGILIVEFANQRREEGLSIDEAVVDASISRMRPILMTSLATILGAVPIALALGGSSTSRIPMGLSIIGGLTFSLGLTLYVIPALYTFITSKKRHT
ncbi:MAG: efflux RND transporter permease subunit [Bacteroidota bacterium]|nr:efflux RND transporter permease subunit [Bacteroidota bacterium]MDX5506404.1 efflux RND transporter permease subunit [Bacteroidota bacterium]